MNLSTQMLQAPMGYEFLEKLGRGGFGTVFKARQRSTGQIVAVKMLSLDGLDEQDRVRKIERFERETRLCADLHHPNIVRLMDKCQADDHHLFAVFEFVQGETLRDLLIREGALTAENTGDLMGQVLDGLACAHERGVVHRDLKPANIMITTTGARQHVKILDFGIGTLVPDARNQDYMSLTLSRETLGTPSYSAPEQLRGEPPTIKSDIYAWGLVFAECLTGKAVMRGATLAEIFYRQLSPDDIPLPSAILGNPLGDLLRRVLQKNHHDRPGQTDRLYDDFRKINLAGIVGILRGGIPDDTYSGPYLETTETVSPWPMLRIERRQITVLCLNLGLTPVRDLSESDVEALDALQRDLLSFCTDTGARYGGYSAGSMGDGTMMFFGYPKAGDSDARLAARTALEIAGQMKRRTVLLTERQGIRVGFRIGIHSGMVTTCEGSQPSGMTPNIAMKLAHLAPAETILASDSTRRLLERYIDFESSECIPLERVQPSPTFFLKGERQAEAFSFLQVGPADVPMVGRDKELFVLRSCWERAMDGQGNTVLLHGEPGIGKSRLTSEIRGLITDDGHASIVYRCLPEHRNNALYPVLEWMKSQLRLYQASSPDDAARRLESALKTCSFNIEWSLPILCSWLTIPLPESYTPVPHSPERQKKILLGVLEEWVLAMAKDVPFLMIVEDLHWADQVTLELIGLLLIRLSEARIMVLLTTRPEFKPPWDMELVSFISLERILPEHAEMMIRKLTGDGPVSPDVLPAVYQRTDGVPLFIEELVRLMIDLGQLIRRDGVYHMHEGFDPASVPITLQDLLNEKLGRLGPARETAQAASAIGREFSVDLLVRASLGDEPSVQVDLDLMAAEGLVYRQRRIDGETYIFRHALIRDAAYNSMVKSVKSLIHGRIAECIETEFPDQVLRDPGGIAVHFAEAGMYVKGVEYGTRATNSALERSLNDEAIFHGHRVLDWADRLESGKQPEAKLAVNNLLTLAMMGKYGWADPRVKNSAESSRELLQGVSGDGYTVPTLWSLAMYHHVAGNRREVRELTDELETIAQRSGDQGLEVASAAFLGLSYQTDGRYTEASEALEKAVRLYDPARHGNEGKRFAFDPRVWAAGTLAIVHRLTGYKAVADECGDNAVLWARELNHIPSLGIALLYRGLAYYHAGNRDGVSRVMDELLELSGKYGLPAFEGYGTVLHCWTTGNEDLAHSILDTLQKMGCRLGLTLYGTMLADMASRKGNIDASVAQIDRCIVLCRDIDEHVHEPVIHLRRALYLLEKHPQGTPDIGASLVKACDIARSQGMLRIEAEAIYERLRLFGVDGELKTRLDQILTLRPEIDPNPARHWM